MWDFARHERVHERAQHRPGDQAGTLRQLTACSRYVPIPQMGHVEADLPFKVEQWDATGARLEQTLSASADLKLGRAAFAEAVRQRPAQRILLRHKTRVIEEYKQ